MLFGFAIGARVHKQTNSGIIIIWEQEIRGVIFNNKEEYGRVDVFYDDKINDFIGFWWITPYNDHLWIDAFVIKPQYQRKGIGSSLMNIIKDYFNIYFPKNQSIELGVQERNAEAVNFYLKHGFKIVDDSYMKTYYTLRMVKKSK